MDKGFFEDLIILISWVNRINFRCYLRIDIFGFLNYLI